MNLAICDISPQMFFSFLYVCQGFYSSVFLRLIPCRQIKIVLFVMPKNWPTQQTLFCSEIRIKICINCTEKCSSICERLENISMPIVKCNPEENCFVHVDGMRNTYSCTCTDSKIALWNYRIRVCSWRSRTG